MTVPQQRMVQIGNESLWNTPVTPTVQLAGITEISVPPSVQIEMQRHYRGVVSPGRDAIIVAHRAENVRMAGRFIFEQAMYWLDGADVATPGGLGPYVYPYNGWTGTPATPRKQTLVFGAGDGVWSLSSMALSGFTLSWQWGQPVNVAWDLMGASIAPDAFAELTEPSDASTTEALGAHVTVAVDAFAGTIGATPAAKCLSGEVRVQLNRAFLPYVGSLYPSGVFDRDAWSVSGRITLVQDATSAAAVNAAIGEVTKRLLRISISNEGLTTALRSYVMDIPAMLRIEELVTDSDDMVTSDLTFEAIEEGDLSYDGDGEVDGYFASALTNNTATAYA